MIRLEDCETRFGAITIFKRRQTGAFVYDQNGSCQSEADCNGVSLASYVHAIYGLIRQTEARDILMIGCGGGTLGTMLFRVGLKVSIVDVNRAAFTLARRYFGLPDEIACHVADGSDYLQSEPHIYDAIVLDAFHGDRIPAHLQSLSFFQRVRSRLGRHGCLFANVHVTDDQDYAPDRIAECMAGAWADVRILDSLGWYGRNAIVAAGNVQRLVPPELCIEPLGHAGEISRELDTMRFRSWWKGT
ncbi:MAG TPA: fused MFS/spermidine synthase [Rhizomicrobium sp.]|nr:fused MFS/spermidine synthase [Rhizomicrobium sp.]